MSKLRIMSNNIWKNDWNCDVWREMGLDCSAQVRAKGLSKVYSETLPDILGIQEASGKMIEELVSDLDELGHKYAVLWGRDTPIFYRPDKFEVIDSYFYIYPEENPGYEGCFNNDKTKSLCIGVFKIKETGKLLVFCSTHLWWQSDDPHSNDFLIGSEAARIYQLSIAMKKADEYAKKYNCPAIIVGDMNADYNSAPLKTAYAGGFIHGHDLATDYKCEEEGYHYCYARGIHPYYPGKFEDAIDHILMKGFDKDTVKRFDRYTPDYYLPLSDHSPLFVDIEY